jgi:hypothetical protein
MIPSLRTGMVLIRHWLLKARIAIGLLRLAPLPYMTVTLWTLVINSRYRLPDKKQKYEKEMHLVFRVRIGFPEFFQKRCLSLAVKHFRSQTLNGDN